MVFLLWVWVMRGSIDTNISQGDAHAVKVVLWVLEKGGPLAIMQGAKVLILHQIKKEIISEDGVFRFAFFPKASGAKVAGDVFIHRPVETLQGPVI